VRDKSSIKGIRWDDIVFNFEYQTTQLPLLTAHIEKSTLVKNRKKVIIDHVQNCQDLDVTGV